MFKDLHKGWLYCGTLLCRFSAFIWFLLAMSKVFYFYGTRDIIQKMLIFKDLQIQRLNKI